MKRTTRDETSAAMCTTHPVAGSAVTRRTALAASTLALLGGGARAQSPPARTPAPASASTSGAVGGWPQRNVRIVVPNPAGGTADLLPRIVSDALATRLGHTVLIDNRPGAAGNIAAEMVFNAEPDGYTLMSAPPPPLTVNLSLYPKLNYDPTRFEPIAVLGIVPNLLMVHESVPAVTVQQFMAYVRANPDKLSYASQGSGSTAHLTAELFKMKTGLKMVHVPYKGDAPAMSDLLGGHVDLMFGNLAAAAPHLKSGKIRVLAVTSEKRVATMPDVPAMNELVPGVVAVTWFGMVAPPKTPTAITAQVSRLVSEILRTPDIARRYADNGAEPVGNTPREMAAFMQEDIEKWRAVIAAGHITPD